MNDFSLFVRSYPVDGLATHDTGINQQFSTILLEFTLQPFVALNAKDGEASILEGLRQSEEHRPEYALGGGTDGEEHLGKGQYIERYAARQHDDACPERQ